MAKTSFFISPVGFSIGGRNVCIGFILSFDLSVFHSAPTAIRETFYFQLSQQRVNCHRQPTIGPRHSRELLSRTGDGKGGGYDWPRVDALDNYSGRVLAERCQGCIYHRKGQAASYKSRSLCICR